MEWLRPAIYGLYELRYMLGEGGSSCCYEALTPGSVKVALKAYKKLSLPGRPFPEYDDEVEAMRDLMGLHCLAGLRGAFYIDFEYRSAVARAHFLELDLYDTTLEYRLRERSLKEAELFSYAADMFTALEGMFSKGYLHLDVTPANLFLRGERAFLGDLGLAMKVEDAAEYEGYAVTALWFRAPEVFGGAPPGPAADVWSAGCVLLAAARCVYEKEGYPWKEASEVAQRAAILKTLEGGGIKGCIPRAPGALVSCIEAMLNITPASRPVLALAKQSFTAAAAAVASGAVRTA